MAVHGSAYEWHSCSNIWDKIFEHSFCIVFLCHQIGGFAGAYLGGYFYDNYGSYDYAWYIAIVLSIFATLVHYPINENPIIKLEQI